MFNTAAEKEEARGWVERIFSNNRDLTEKAYVRDKQVLEENYRADIAANERGRREALVEAGFGPDGSDPPVAPA